MGAVAFHTDVADKTAYIVRLVRKASRQGARLVVVCDDPLAVSKALWGASNSDFMAHATPQSDATTQANSPVVLAPSAMVSGRDLAQDVLVNARLDWSEAHATFDRVIELVGQSPDEVVSGRARWKRYTADGIQPEKLG
jgi:DNA polymerase III subunit chi